MSLRIKLIFGTLLACLMSMTAWQANASFTVHYKPDLFGGWQSIPGVPQEPFPLSYQEAVQRDFYFIFDSFYPVKGSTAWAGDLVDFSSPLLGLRCRLQIGGYLWQEGQEPKVMNFTVTHHRIDKPSPPGFPKPSPLCMQVPPAVLLAFNNGLPLGAPWAGAWTTIATPAMVNAGAFANIFNNVQVTMAGANCAAAPGNGGQLPYQYNENPPGVRATIDLNGMIMPPGPGNCNIFGRLYSIWEKAQIFDPNHTPSAPNPSPLSRGVIDEITNP